MDDSLVRIVLTDALSTVNKPPRGARREEGCNVQGAPARAPEARDAGRPGNYVRNSLARVNTKRTRVHIAARE